jgi:hypothetical protein
MSSGVPEKLKVDFSGLARDLAARALTRLLSQHWTAPVLKQFVAALIRTGPQETYDRIIRTQEAQTIYLAEGVDLEAIGRIVGQPRTPYRYDDSRWFFWDRAGQGFEQQPWWVEGAPTSGNEPAGDPEYRQMILARIACNLNRHSSSPEMAYLADFSTGEKVSWRRTGPMECEILVSADISRSHLEVMTKAKTTPEADDIFMLPYPATLKLSRVAFIPEKPFVFDRWRGHQFDAGKWAAGFPL